jgi:hypothetical protein
VYIEIDTEKERMLKTCIIKIGNLIIFKFNWTEQFFFFCCLPDSEEITSAFFFARLEYAIKHSLEEDFPNSSGPDESRRMSK